MGRQNTLLMPPQWPLNLAQQTTITLFDASRYFFQERLCSELA